MKNATNRLFMKLVLCLILIMIPAAAQGETVTEGMSTDWSSANYELNEDVTLNGRIHAKGDVKLYLHGHTLVVNGGIYVPNSGKLFVYGPGTLEAHAEDVDGAAGIGGNEDSGVGILFIDGATVLAWGGDGGAGIGGGEDGDAKSGNINIRSGSTVKAWGGNDGAGIGGGDGSSATSPLIDIVSGSNVEAHGTNTGAGIGCGYNNDVINTIVMTNSSVTATGGFNGGAGINGKVIIDNGTVTATGNGGGAGIGSNKNEHYAGTVTIYAGDVTAKSEKYGAGIGAGNDGDFKEIPHNTAAHLAAPFPTSATCRFLDYQSR